MLSALCQANVKWQSANVTSNKVQIALKQKKVQRECLPLSHCQCGGSVAEKKRKVCVIKKRRQIDIFRVDESREEMRGVRYQET